MYLSLKYIAKAIAAPNKIYFIHQSYTKNLCLKYDNNSYSQLNLNLIITNQYFINEIMRLSLFFLLHLVAFVILLIVHPHARADDGWAIERHNKILTYISNKINMFVGMEALLILSLFGLIF